MSSHENNSFTRATREGQREFDLGNFEAADHFFRLALDEAGEGLPKFFLRCNKFEQSSSA